MNQFVGQQQVEAEGEAFHTGSPFGCSVVWNRTNGSCKQEGNEEQRVIGNEEEHRRSDLQYGPEDSMKEKTKGEMEDDDLKTPKRRGEEVSWIQKVCWHQQKIWPFQRTTSASADGARAVLIMFLVLIVALAIQFGVWVLVFAPFTASSGWKKVSRNRATSTRFRFYGNVCSQVSELLRQSSLYLPSVCLADGPRSSHFSQTLSSFLKSHSTL